MAKPPNDVCFVTPEKELLFKNIREPNQYYRWPMFANAAMPISKTKLVNRLARYKAL